MKSFTGKLPLSVTTIIVCVFALAVILYAEDIRTLTRSSMFKLRSCSKQCTTTNPSDPNTGENEDLSLLEDNLEDEEKPVFDPNKCSVTKGKWVFNSSARPLYSDRTCPYLDRQFECVKNGRPDSDYQHWEWKPDDCFLPRFDAKITLKKLRGKRIMFVGDSLQRGQWESFVCMIESHLPKEQKSMKRGPILSVFKAKEYNTTVEFYWAPFLIESNSDEHIIGDPNKRILRVDAIAKHAKNWEGVDVLLFNTYVWWMSGLKIKSLWGSFSNGEEGFEELDAVTAYRIGLKTWANWVDSTVNSNKTRVFFTTMSPTHMRSADWHHKGGIRCYNETRPVLERGYWGSGSDKRLMKVVESIVQRMKVPVTFLNITQLSEHRIDGHTSVYTETHGKILTDEQKSNPKTYADCIHWCLPGVPDTWNQLLYSYL